jgi:hypothetical protein
MVLGSVRASTKNMMKMVSVMVVMSITETTRQRKYG